MSTTAATSPGVEVPHINAIALAERWWMIALRGVAAIAFGILTFVYPGLSLTALVALFGAYALVDGILNLVVALRRKGRRWGWLLFEGIVGIGAGLLTFVWPRITALALLMVIASWAVITGFAEIAAAVRLRKQIRGEWTLILAGVFSILFGVLLFMYPAAGALAVVFWIGAYATIFGVLLLTLSLRLRAWGHRPERQFPSGGMPRPV